MSIYWLIPAALVIVYLCYELTREQEPDEHEDLFNLDNWNPRGKKDE